MATTLAPVVGQDEKKKKAEEQGIEERKTPVSQGGSPRVPGADWAPSSVDVRPVGSVQKVQSKSQGLQQGGNGAQPQNVQNATGPQAYKGSVQNIPDACPDGNDDVGVNTVESDSTPTYTKKSNQISGNIYESPVWGSEDDNTVFAEDNNIRIGRKNENGEKVYLDKNGNPVTEDTPKEDYATVYMTDGNQNVYTPDQAYARVNATDKMRDKSVYNGNVDLLHRPKVDSSAMLAAGWKDFPEGSYATLYSQQEGFAQRDPATGVSTKKEVLYTPILADGTVMRPEEVTQYLSDLGGKGDIAVLDKPENGGKGIVIRTGDEGDLGGEELSRLQDTFYQAPAGGRLADVGKPQREAENKPQTPPEQKPPVQQTPREEEPKPYISVRDNSGNVYNYKTPGFVNPEHASLIGGTKSYTVKVKKKQQNVTLFVDKNGYVLDKSGRPVAPGVIDGEYKKGNLVVAEPYTEAADTQVQPAPKKEEPKKNEAAAKPEPQQKSAEQKEKTPSVTSVQSEPSGDLAKDTNSAVEKNKAIHSELNGNVDIARSLSVPAEEMKAKGWDYEGDEPSSLYAVSTGALKWGDINGWHFLFSPIAPDGTVYTKEEVKKYLEGLGELPLTADNLENGGKGLIIAASKELNNLTSSRKVSEWRQELRGGGAPQGASTEPKKEVSSTPTPKTQEVGGTDAEKKTSTPVATTPTPPTTPTAKTTTPSTTNGTPTPTTPSTATSTPPADDKEKSDEEKEKEIERKVQYDLDNEEGAAIEQRNLDDLLDLEKTLMGALSDKLEKDKKEAGVDKEGDEKFEKRRKRNQLIAAIGDVLQGFANIWGVSQGAKSQTLTSLSGSSGEGYTAASKERETRRAKLEEDFQKRADLITKEYDKKAENLMKRMYDSKKRSEEHDRKLEILALNQENKEKIEALKQEYSLQKLAEAYEYRIKYLDEQLKNNLLTLSQKQEYAKELEEIKHKHAVVLKQTQGLKNR